MYTLTQELVLQRERDDRNNDLLNLGKNLRRRVDRGDDLESMKLQHRSSAVFATLARSLSKWSSRHP